MPKYYREKQQFEIVKREEIEKYIQKAKEMNREDLALLIALAWLLGARISELLLLRKRDILIKEKEIRIDLVTLKQRKRTIREIILDRFNDPFMPWLEQYVNSLTDEDSRLFNVSRRRYQQLLLKINKELHGEETNKYITFHYLRHSFITYVARELRASDYEIRSLTGHSSRAYEEYIIRKATARIKGLFGKRR